MTAATITHAYRVECTRCLTNAYGTAEPSRLGPLCRGGAHVIDLDAEWDAERQSSAGLMTGASGDRRDGGSAAAVPAAPAPGAVA